MKDIQDERRRIEREYMEQKKADTAVIYSGGLDSTTLVYHLMECGFTPHLLSFNYGQRHKKELTYAIQSAIVLGLRHDIIDLTSISELISNSALTSQNAEHGDIAVPDGHYAEETMKATVVPNRNMIMLSIATGIAVNNGYAMVATGVHSGDHFIYPDCRPRFIRAANAAAVLGNMGFGTLAEIGEGEYVPDFIVAPFQHMSKADIAYRALELSVPLHETWSCYKGGIDHCGKCGTCVERLEAIHEAMQRWDANHLTTIEMDKGNTSPNTRELDRTVYEDAEFWKTATKS
jgi:7-cyano-7-deazaguanine synthase